MYSANPLQDILNVLSSLGTAVIAFLPKLIGAIMIFLVGWLVAVALGKVVAQIVKALKVDQALKSLGAEDPFSRAGFRLDSGAFIGGLVRWFFIIVFLIAAVDVFELDQVTEFLRRVALYLPNVIVAAIILVSASLIGGALQKVVEGSAKAARLPSASLLGGIAKWAIWIFAILAALDQLSIAEAFARTLFIGLVSMIAIAGGLAFGLGGKEQAARFIERLKSDISGR
ncbi:MAG: hypothetical protein A3C80_02635 [Candidatus Ryanbacteria bacterium RIFCSPHIGHO2_02_FULL_45_43]|uniref:Small-conductance mechanosensitive ion channel n=1 Tax=Candidatus Ryanbacteria bacterium RIFCSPHIGHO2_01_45_13 TaxID=1802112 RepID=A0A1G2FZM1_9BACT|nr:MAG: hypothetical protein A2718_01050 [Candidatus Ryanbacteria bacterium RIFCSPHIGHO2_01_FULL_44_130]OGZ43496.1 MAG: hypothetical protein A2W41_04125 [Candidatus Ryanbacteria bacterium RIFCSPHIGHO2_01_45_13]OGZ47840.1 MAG: hypothetical protein A3C80_02635 [Candidatus Ryanbacteria bacterium RIFCSPHIGHO2_02_FULL_45_43]OGZ49885.1 MAG: hypothetical protein A3E55_03670 [Candidatus Ryanbacteria bacterium RIFCSPHIGHO2_12_FULL_44_20]OGZ50995.1 MAG: hypothetical protein A3A17_03210 [Candidatus Ryanba